MSVVFFPFFLIFRNDWLFSKSYEDRICRLIVYCGRLWNSKVVVVASFWRVVA